MSDTEMADAEKGKTREEEEYVPADYVAPAGADDPERPEAEPGVDVCQFWTPFR